MYVIHLQFIVATNHRRTVA